MHPIQHLVVHSSVMVSIVFHHLWVLRRWREVLHHMVLYLLFPDNQLIHLPLILLFALLKNNFIIFKYHLQIWTRITWTLLQAMILFIISQNKKILFSDFNITKAFYCNKQRAGTPMSGIRSHETILKSAKNILFLINRNIDKYLSVEKIWLHVSETFYLKENSRFYKRLLGWSCCEIRNP